MKDKYVLMRGCSQLYQAIGEALERVCKARQIAKDYDLLNSLMYLDFEDKLNAFSVADPNE